MVSKIRLWGFTLVELVVVITMVWILSTVGFVAYTWYLTGARDSNRMNQIVQLSDSLQVYGTSKNLPFPDSRIQITASGQVIGYQWVMGDNVLETISYSNGGRDPKDASYFTYYLLRNRSDHQLVAFMEEADTVLWYNSIKGLFPQSHADNFIDRFPQVYGSEIGLLLSAETDTRNTPAQEIVANKIAWSLDIANTSDTYTAVFEDLNDVYTANGYTLWGLVATRIGNRAPARCPEGFVAVPGNAEFHPEWFCVAQYEMTYEDADTPNSTAGGTDWNTVAYEEWKEIVSMAGKYPIADITQQAAINACASIWDGYHLITNDQWMTIARNIEANEKNWSWRSITDGLIYNWVSWDSTRWCNRTGWNTEPRAYATLTGPWADETCNSRRSHALSNGQLIWDFAGNVYEQVNKANNKDGVNHWLDQTTIAGSTNNSGWDDDGIYDLEDMEKYGAATFVGVANGVGNVTRAGWVSNNVFYRWAAASHVQNTGIYTIMLWFSSANFNRDVGFRCVR